MPAVFIAADDLTGANAAAAGLLEHRSDRAGHSRPDEPSQTAPASRGGRPRGDGPLGHRPQKDRLLEHEPPEPDAVALPATASPAQITDAAARFDVVALSTDSRHLPPDAAALATQRAIAAAWPARLIASRCDSTLRGNMAAEAAAAVATVRELVAASAESNRVGPVIGLCMPAFPTAGRTTEHGRQLLHGVPLEDTELARDVRSPIAGSNVLELLRCKVGLSASAPGAQDTLHVEHVDIDTVAAGQAALLHRFRELIDVPTGARDNPPAPRRSPPDIIVADARTDDDLHAIAHAAVAAAPHATWVAIDPGPGTRALAEALNLVPHDVPVGTQAEPIQKGNVPVGTSRESHSTQPAGTVLAVSGSASELTRRQLAHLVDHHDVKIVWPNEVSTAASTAASVESSLTASVTAPEVLLIPTVLDESDLRPLTSAQANELTAELGRLAARVLGEYQAGFPDGESDEDASPSGRPDEQPGSVPPALTAPRISGLYTTGGDVTAAVLAAIGATGIRIDSHVMPLAVKGRVLGGPHDGLPIVTKGGMVGDPATASAGIDALLNPADTRRKVPS